MKKAYVTGLLFACLTGLSFFGSKIALRYGDALEILAWRFLFAFVAMVVWQTLRTWGERRAQDDFRAIHKSRRAGLLLGAVYAAFLGAQLIGLMTCTSVVGAILNTLVPVLVALLARVVLREKLTALQWGLMVVSTVAVFYMIWRGRGDISYTRVGLLCLLVSMLCIALYNLLLRAYSSRISSFDAVYHTSLVGAAVFWLAFVVRGIAAGDVGQCGHIFHEPLLLVATLYLGVGCVVLTNALISYTLRYLTAARGAIFNDLATVISIAMGALALGEPFYLYHAVCSAIVIACVIMMNPPTDGGEAK